MSDPYKTFVEQLTESDLQLVRHSNHFIDFCLHNGFKVSEPFALDEYINCMYLAEDEESTFKLKNFLNKLRS